MAVVFKLAQKCSSRYKDELTAKSKELYQKVIALDPAGKAGTYTYDYLKATVPYTEAAEFELAQSAAFGRTPDPAPAKAFVDKYPRSPLVKQVYMYLARYYQYYSPGETGAADAAAKAKAEQGKIEATKFFDVYAAKYPESASVLNTYVDYIIKQKGPVDKGLELAEKVKELTGYPENPEYMQNLAELYYLKGDETKANEEYGKDFIDGYVSTTISALTGYANFWLEKGKNLDSVEAMADLAAKMASPTQTYYLQQVAGVYVKLKKMDKALAIYGPDLVTKSGGDANVLLSYAAFWNRQNENLPSALEAAKKVAALGPDYYSYFTLAQILFKLKNYAEALPAAEKAVELVKPMVAKYQFPIAPYETLVKQIKDAMAKEKGAKPEK